MGSIASMLFLVLPSSSPVWYLAAVLAAIANVSFGASIVAMNAYLPGLARESFEVVEARRAMLAEMDSSANPRPSGSNSDDTEDDAAPLLAGEHPNPESPTSARGAYDTALSLATSRLSSLGVALGYSAGILLLLLTLVPVTLLKGTTFSLRLAIGASGIWWALFSLPAFLWLPSGHTESTGQKWSFMKEVGAAWVKLGTMLRWREIKKLKNTFIYLAAWFLLSDGFTTITSTAILFAKTTLFMPASSLILIGVLTPSAGILGSFTAPIIQRRLKVSNLTVVVTLVILASLLPIYGCLGFIPAFRDGNVKFGGLTTPGEMFVLAVYFGGLYGAFQGYARAFYAELVPPGEEARWFALFSITDKVRPSFSALIRTLSIRAVELFLRSLNCWFNCGCDRKHSIRVFLLSWDDMGRRSDPVTSERASGEARCKSLFGNLVYIDILH